MLTIHSGALMGAQLWENGFTAKREICRDALTKHHDIKDSPPQ
jgi:hypothetical protein